MEENFKSYIASGCKVLYNGQLMRCLGVIAFEKLDEQFGTSYEVTEDEGWFDIHKTDMDAWHHSKKAELSDYILMEREK